MNPTKLPGARISSTSQFLFFPFPERLASLCLGLLPPFQQEKLESMSGREVREYTNLSDPKDKKWGKGKDRVDDEDITFQRMVAKMQEVAGERGGYLHGRGALDSDDLLYLKEQMEAEEDAERLLRRTEKRAFAAFKRAANLADSTPASLPLPLRVEPKPKSGIRQQDLLKKIVEVKPKKLRASSPSKQTQGFQSSPILVQVSLPTKTERGTGEGRSSLKAFGVPQNSFVLIQASSTEITEQRSTAGRVTDSDMGNPVKSLLGIAYESSDED